MRVLGIDCGAERVGLVHRHHVAERVADERARFADCHHHLRARPDRLAQQPQVASLEPSADDRHQIAVEALDRSQRRLDVGRFRIVDEAHAGRVGDQLHGVLEPAEAVDGRRHRRRRRAGDRADRGRRHHVVDQMRAEQMDRVERHEPIGGAAPPLDDPSVFDDRAFVDRAAPREVALHRAAAPREVEDRRIVGVDHREVARLLVLEDPRLRRAVGLHRRMPIEVVRREVQHHADPRVECVDLLELEAARLDDVERVGRRRRHLRAERRADVAADGHLESRRLEHPARQGRRRRLALRAGDRDHAAAEPPRRELDLGDDRHAALARRLHHGRVRRHARAEDDEIRARERLAHVAAGFERDAKGAQPIGVRNLGGDLRQRHTRAAPREQLRSGDAAPRRAGDGDAPVGDVEWRARVSLLRHRSFNVARLNSAKMIARITKRVITFGSLQPISSKWWWRGAMRNSRCPPVALK